jgi:signal transduction histidine kinase
MTAGLSHEIRNPLNAASLQLTVLERRLRRIPLEHQPRLLEPLALVRDEIQRLEHLLEDFLRFARPRELTVRALDTGALIEKVVVLLRGDAERRGIMLFHELEPHLPRVDGDEERLHQVLMNLALNALEATPTRGKVRISTSVRGERVRINVDDSGPGIPADLRNRIFEPFFTTKAAGSGLGLPIVHAIISQHGGDVRVETSPLGGTRMQVELVRARV